VQSFVVNKILILAFVLLINCTCEMKNIKLTDLARMLSLNPSTVSRALSNHPDISDDTRARVLNAAHEFKYRPNLRARFFRKKKSGLIGLILPEINSFFIPKMIEGINSVLSAAGFSTIIFCSDNNLDKEKELLDHCLSWAVEGIIISLSDFSADDSHLLVAREAGIPVMLLDKILSNSQFSSISINDYEASFMAVKHLIENNKRRLLGIFANAAQENTRQRAKGMQDALSNAGVPWHENDFMFMMPGNTAFHSQLETKLRSDSYDAVFIMSDELLLLSYAVLLNFGLLQNKLGVAAISDGVLPQMLAPKITHVRHSGGDMGKMAGKALLSIINEKNYEAVAHKISPVLISPESM
jgi:LacI family transcriptional regulator